MKLIGIIIGALFCYIVPKALFKQRQELTEAQPFTFEKDEPVENYKEIYSALAEMQKNIEEKKREGVL